MLPDNSDLERSYYKARDVGFNAIGVYPFWKPYKGMHLAIRHPLETNAAWSDIGTGGQHKYVALTKGFEYG